MVLICFCFFQEGRIYDTQKAEYEKGRKVPKPSSFCRGWQEAAACLFFIFLIYSHCDSAQLLFCTWYGHSKHQAQVLQVACIQLHSFCLLRSLKYPEESLSPIVSLLDKVKQTSMGQKNALLQLLVGEEGSLLTLKGFLLTVRMDRKHSPRKDSSILFSKYYSK